MGFSFDIYFDPILRQAFDEFESSVPAWLRVVYRKLAERLIAFSIDEAVKGLLERLIAEYLKTDRSQPFEGFALARMTDSDAEKIEIAGLDPLTILTAIAYAIQVIEWFRKRSVSQPMALAVEGPRVVDGLVLKALVMAPDDAE